MEKQLDRVAEDGVTQLLDMAASDKIQILSAPIQLPGVCGICGTSRTDDRSYIDIGLWFEMYGQFYFCTYCMTQMVNRLGGLTPEQAEELHSELNQARQTILEFQETKARVDGAIESLRNTGLFSDPVIDNADTDSFMDTKQDTPRLVTKSERDEYISPESSKDSSEFISEQGSDGVSGPRDDELSDWL